MNRLPPNHDPADDADDRYRRASASDPSRPSEAVRRAVLAHATKLAGRRAALAAPLAVASPRPAPNRVPRRAVIFGALAAAAESPSTRARSASGDTEPAPEASLAKQPAPRAASGLTNRSIAAASSSNAVAALPQAAGKARSEGSPEDTAGAFRRAAENGDLAALHALLGKQSDINARDSLGRTALMLATLSGQTNAAAALLAYGADPN